MAARFAIMTKWDLYRAAMSGTAADMFRRMVWELHSPPAILCSGCCMT